MSILRRVSNAINTARELDNAGNLPIVTAALRTLAAITAVGATVSYLSGYGVAIGAVTAFVPSVLLGTYTVYRSMSEWMRLIEERTNNIFHHFHQVALPRESIVQAHLPIIDSSQMGKAAPAA